MPRCLTADEMKSLHIGPCPFCGAKKRYLSSSFEEGWYCGTKRWIGRPLDERDRTAKCRLRELRNTQRKKSR